MKTITFIRHGESTANAGGVTMSHDAIPLSETGLFQALRLAPLLPPNPAAILVSSYIRTSQTAAPYCHIVGVEPLTHPLLHEFSTVDPALMFGMLGAQRKPFVEEFWRVPSLTKRMGDHAETFSEFNERVTSFLAVMDTFPANTVIFGHGMWIGLLVWHVLGFTCQDDLDMKAFRRFQAGLPMPNCAAYHFFQDSAGVWSARVDASILRFIRSGFHVQ